VHSGVVSSGFVHRRRFLSGSPPPQKARDFSLTTLGLGRKGECRNDGVPNIVSTNVMMCGRFQASVPEAEVGGSDNIGALSYLDLLAKGDREGVYFTEKCCNGLPSLDCFCSKHVINWHAKWNKSALASLSPQASPQGFVAGAPYRCLRPIVIPFAARYVEIFFGMMRYYAEFLGWFVAAVHTVAPMTVAAVMILFLSCCSINYRNDKLVWTANGFNRRDSKPFDWRRLGDK